MELTLEQALQKGIEAHKAGNAQEADRYYTAVLKANPKHPDANHNMGVLAVSVGKTETSLSYFKTALQANPGVAQFWLSYMDTLIKLNHMDEAKAIFDQAKSKGAKGNGFDKIEKKLGTSTDKKSNDQELSQKELQPLINLYNQNRLQQVLIEASALTKKYDNSTALWSLIGASAAQIGKFNEAVLAFQKVVSIDPKNAQAFNNMGNLFRQQEKLDEAIQAYQKALSLKPDLAETHYNMGIALKAHGELDRAIKAYNKALSIKPDYAEAHNNMGAIFQDQGKLEEAIEAYKKALSIKPDYAEAQYNMGVVFQDQGKLEEAIQNYDKANDPVSVAQALECFYRLEDFDNFDLRLHSIAQRDPTNIRVAALSAFVANQRHKEDLYPFCKNPIERIRFSHIKNHVSDPDSFIANILNEMHEEKLVWEPKNKTTKNGFQSNNKLFSKSSPNIKILENILIKELNHFRAEFYNNESSLFQKWPDNLKMDAWYVRMLKNGHQGSHIHPTGWVSGVFYLKTVEAPVEHEGAIEFGLHGYDYPVINEDYPKRLYQPINGDLVLFPSSLFHKTIPVIKDVERCIIAFDLVP